MLLPFSKAFAPDPSLWGSLHSAPSVLHLESCLLSNYSFPSAHPPDSMVVLSAPELNPPTYPLAEIPQSRVYMS